MVVVCVQDRKASCIMPIGVEKEWYCMTFT